MGTNTAGTDVPDLQYPDIYNYLINFPSAYSGAENVEKLGGIQMDSVWIRNEYSIVEPIHKKALCCHWTCKLSPHYNVSIDNE